MWFRDPMLRVHEGAVERIRISLSLSLPRFFVYVCMYVCMYVCICTYACMYVYACIYTCKNVCVCIQYENKTYIYIYTNQLLRSPCLNSLQYLYDCARCPRLCVCVPPRILRCVGIWLSISYHVGTAGLSYIATSTCRHCNLSIPDSGCRHAVDARQKICFIQQTCT